jgi:hypothetical protein
MRTAELDPFRDVLPEAIPVLDDFHVEKPGSAMVDEVRRRVQQETLGHRAARKTRFTGSAIPAGRRGTPQRQTSARLDALLSAGGPGPRGHPRLAVLPDASQHLPGPPPQFVAEVVSSFRSCPITEVARIGRTLRSGGTRFRPPSTPTAPSSGLPKRSTTSLKPPAESPAASATSVTTGSNAYLAPAAISLIRAKRANRVE